MNLKNKSYFDKLQVDEVFAFFEIPRLFTCKSPAGQFYVVSNVAEDQNSATWIYVAVSPVRLAEAKSGSIDLRDLIMNAEDGIVFLLQSYIDGRDHTVSELTIDQLDKSYLPEVGEYLVEPAPCVQIDPFSDEEWSSINEEATRSIQQNPSSIEDLGLAA